MKLDDDCFWLRSFSDMLKVHFLRISQLGFEFSQAHAIVVFVARERERRTQDVRLFGTRLFDWGMNLFYFVQEKVFVQSKRKTRKILGQILYTLQTSLSSSKSLHLFFNNKSNLKKYLENTLKKTHVLYKVNP